MHPGWSDHGGRPTPDRVVRHRRPDITGYRRGNDTATDLERFWSAAQYVRGMEPSDWEQDSGRQAGTALGYGSGVDFAVLGPIRASMGDETVRLGGPRPAHRARAC